MHVQFDRRELRFQPPKFFLRQTQESAVGVRACARRFHFGAGGFPFVSLLSVVWTTLRMFYVQQVYAFRKPAYVRYTT